MMSPPPQMTGPPPHLVVLTRPEAEIISLLVFVSLLCKSVKSQLFKELWL